MDRQQQTNLLPHQATGPNKETRVENKLAYAALQGLPLFCNLPGDIVQGLAVSGRFARHEKGDGIVAQGQALSRVYLLLDGWCGASKGNLEGQEAILHLYRSGDFMPDADMAGDGATPCPVTLQALTPVNLFMVPPRLIQNAAERVPAFAASLLAAANRRCQELRDHVEQLTLHTAEQRVGRFLLNVRSPHDQTGQDIVLPFEKAHIASYLGIKPETLSRVLQHFKENGFTIDRQHITLPARDALCDYCDAAAMKTCRFAHSKDCTHSAHNEAVF